jgi:DNA polymerase V
MSALDAINRRWGRGTVQLSVEGLKHGWAMRREHLSPACTSDWAQLLKVRAT